jgi:hypothetical protein
MKTLIILSAFLLALSSCTKEMPVPDPDPVYTPDPGPDPDPAPDPGDDDPGDDDPPSCYNNHPGSTITWLTATNIRLTLTNFDPLG